MRTLLAGLLLLAAPSHAGVAALESAKAASAFDRLPAFTAFKAARPVRISGHVNLNGHAFVHEGQNNAHVNFTGWANFRSDDGTIQSGSTSISHTEFVWVHSDHVTAHVRPWVHVSLYRNGKYLGSARLDGTIFVSGWRNGSTLHMNGSGTLSTTVWIDEDGTTKP
jgi:hypothetical protein